MNLSTIILLRYERLSNSFSSFFFCVVEMWTLVKHSFQTCACQTYFWGNNLSNIVLKWGYCACHSFRKWEFVKHHSVE